LAVAVKYPSVPRWPQRSHRNLVDFSSFVWVLIN
jgi:hypothetical protein